MDTQSLDENFAIPPVNEIGRIQVSLNKIAAMEELQVDILEESFAILSVNEGSDMLSNIGISR